MKRFLSCLLACALLLALAVPSLAVTAKSSTQKLKVNGEAVDCEKYNIDGNNYFKLRDLAALLNGTGSQFDVGYDTARRLVSITTDHAYTDPKDTDLVVGADKSATTKFGTQTILIDGKARGDLRAYNIGGNNYFQLRELGAALGFEVDYDAATRTMLVQSRDSAIRVTDRYAETGFFTNNAGYIEQYSFVLPEVSGADTAYIRSINQEMEDLWEAEAEDALRNMREEQALTHFCISYYYGVKNGVHSLLITSDNEFDQNEYRCYNFDDAGNELDSAAVLQAAGLTADGFVARAKEFLKQITEIYVEYGWQDLQDSTISEENLNASNPMVILPNGNLCFIAAVFTPAGAGEYDEAFELAADGTVSDADLGQTLLSRLSGTFVTEPDEEGIATLYELVSVGDTLTLEATSFYPEYESAVSYAAIDLYPEDPAALLRADVSSLRVRAVSWCPDVFGGSYSADARPCMVCAAKDGLLLVNLADDGATIRAKRCYRDELGLDDGVPETDYDKFSFDAVSEAGLPGVWTGTYLGEDLALHDLTLELSSWGGMKLRDCAPNAIPRVLEGSYYIASLNDDFGPAGSVVFQLTARGGYKMPVNGCVTMIATADTLEIYEEAESAYPLTQRDSDAGAATLTRVPAVRGFGASEVRALAEGERAYADTAGDGTPEEIGFVFRRDADYPEAITGVTVTVEGEEFPLDCVDAYHADVYLITPALHGASYLYIDAVSDNDYHITSVVGVRLGQAWHAGDFRGGFDAKPADANAMRLFSRTALLSSVNATRSYRVGLGGLPEATDSFYRIASDLELTSKIELSAWVIVPETGALAPEDATIPAGTKLKMIRTDAASAVDLRLPDGTVRRVFVSDWPRCIDGVPIEDCFDGILFAG